MCFNCHETVKHLQVISSMADKSVMAVFDDLHFSNLIDGLTVVIAKYLRKRQQGALKQ